MEKHNSYSLLDVKKIILTVSIYSIEVLQWSMRIFFHIVKVQLEFSVQSTLNDFSYRKVL